MKALLNKVGFRIVGLVLGVGLKRSTRELQQLANFSSNQNPSSNDGYRGIYMGEVKGFSSNQLGLAKNTPKWAFLHLYGLLKSPKIPNPKIHGPGPLNKVTQHHK